MPKFSNAFNERTFRLWRAHGQSAARTWGLKTPRVFWECPKSGGGCVKWRAESLAAIVHAARKRLESIEPVIRCGDIWPFCVV
jgi:hypothetical protein